MKAKNNAIKRLIEKNNLIRTHQQDSDDNAKRFARDKVMKLEVS